MQQNIQKWALLITKLGAILSILILTVGCGSHVKVEAVLLDPAAADRILQATVQIAMVEHEYQQVAAEGQAESWQQVTHITNGLGTLVSFKGKVLLVSHDHWSLFNSGTAPDKVLFHDASGTLLLEMNGADLLPLILFHDSGTFILRAPAALADRTSAQMGGFEYLNPGDIVHVVHRDPVRTNQVSLVAAEVVAVQDLKSVPVLSLRRLDGGSIEPGDSGGGIWVDGNLTGNLWTTVREVSQNWWNPEESVQKATDTSMAAGLRVQLIDLLEILLGVNSPSSVQDSGVK